MDCPGFLEKKAYFLFLETLRTYPPSYKKKLILIFATICIPLSLFRRIKRVILNYKNYVTFMFLRPTTF